jgi:hypothetical protein
MISLIDVCRDGFVFTLGIITPVIKKICNKDEFADEHYTSYIIAFPIKLMYTEYENSMYFECALFGIGLYFSIGTNEFF